MIDTAVLESLEPMIESIAAEYGRRHRVHGADLEDFGQELRLWVIKNEAKVLEWLDPELWEPKAGEKMLAKSLRNEAKDYGVDIKAQAVGYERSDLHWYSKGEVKSLLPNVFNPDAWQEPPKSEGRSTKAPSEGGNWVTTLADVAQAIAKLDLYDQSILRAFHKDGWTNKMMADVEKVSESLMSYYHDRAVSRLVKVLGDEQPKPMRTQSDKRDPWRGRRAVTNSTARSINSRTYDDE
jgi:hypothetical protein